MITNVLQSIQGKEGIVSLKEQADLLMAVYDSLLKGTCTFSDALSRLAEISPAIAAKVQMKAEQDKLAAERKLRIEKDKEYRELSIKVKSSLTDINDTVPGWTEHLCDMILASSSVEDVLRKEGLSDIASQILGSLPAMQELVELISANGLEVCLLS